MAAQPGGLSPLKQAASSGNANAQGTYTVTGGRAELFLPNNLGTLILAGVFDTCSVARSIGTEAIHILGQYSAVEIPITSYNECTINCSGFRVVGAGTEVLGAFPTLQSLLNYSSVSIKVVDRQTGVTIVFVKTAVPTSDNQNFSARATSKTSITYTGIAAETENTAGDGSSGDSEQGTPSWP